MSNHYKCFPTVRIHSSKAISTDGALEFVTAYLENAETDDSLNPNAILTATGPVATRSGTTGSGSSLTIHNLQRIQAGLRGEHLGPSPKFGAEEELPDDEVVPETPVKKRTDKGLKRAAEAGEEGEGGAEDWQDPEEFKEQQEEIEGEIEDRMPNVVEGAQAVANSKVVDKGADREARKKAKKERKNAEKKDREKARRSKAETEA